jgi:uncharacterized protein GlcG (DUF336 family)
MTGIWLYISAGIAIVIGLLIAGLAVAILLALLQGKIDLKYLITEPADPRAQVKAQIAFMKAWTTAGKPEEIKLAPPEEPKASMSRLQLLIFTFVIAGVYLVLCLEGGRFVDIPNNVLLLLGISGGTYAASKTIKAASDAKQADADSKPKPPATPTPTPAAPVTP